MNLNEPTTLKTLLAMAADHGGIFYAGMRVKLEVRKEDPNDPCRKAAGKI